MQIEQVTDKEKTENTASTCSVENTYDIMAGINSPDAVLFKLYFVKAGQNSSRKFQVIVLSYLKTISYIN